MSFETFLRQLQTLNSSLETLAAIGAGDPWMTTEIEGQLRTLGFDSIETFSPMPPVLFVLGRRSKDG